MLYIRVMIFLAVILGTAIYAGNWPKEATVFLKLNEHALQDRPFWLFTSGPTGVGDPFALVVEKRVPSAVQPVLDRIHPRDVTIFHGNIQQEIIKWIEKWAIKNLVKKPTGDFRDWDTIYTWTNSILAGLPV